MVGVLGRPGLPISGAELWARVGGCQGLAALPVETRRETDRDSPGRRWRGVASLSRVDRLGVYSERWTLDHPQKCRNCQGGVLFDQLHFFKEATSFERPAAEGAFSKRRPRMDIRVPQEAKTIE